MRCADCKGFQQDPFWTSRGKGYPFIGWGTCGIIPEACASDPEHEAPAGTLAQTVDAEGYASALYVSSEFFCALFEARYA